MFNVNRLRDASCPLGRSLLRSGLIGCTLLGTVSNAGATTYHVTDLGIGYVFQINRSALGAGIQGYDEGLRIAGALFDHGEIQLLPGFNLGTPIVMAEAINDAGIPVGVASIDDGIHSHAVRWVNGEIEDLGTLGDYYLGSEARGINSKGEICGWSEIPLGLDSFYHPHGYRAVIVNTSGKMINVGLPSWASSAECTAINDKSHFVGVGYSGVNMNAHAFISRKGNFVRLDPDSYYVSVPEGMNNKDQVVGYASRSAADQPTAFLWNDGNLIDLGVLPGGAGTTSQALAINDAGVIVGYCSTNGANGSTAIVHQEGVMLDLNTLLDASGAGWYLYQAETINAKGQISGLGLINGEDHAFLLDPMP